MKAAILVDHSPDSAIKWEVACRFYSIEYLTVDVLRNDWLLKLKQFEPDICLSRPPGDILQNKRLFDERIFYIQNFLNFKVFPGYLETYLYENKSSLALFLEVNDISHPSTFISSEKAETLDFLAGKSFPIVAKTIIGAAGSGVKILHNRDEAEIYIRKVFKKGIRRRFGPNRVNGSPEQWLKKAIKSPEYFIKKTKEYLDRNKDVQRNLVIFQDYIPHSFEWRCVKIGNSYFGYKKLKVGEMASGAKQFEYGPVPSELLTFMKNVCEKYNFFFMAADIFCHNGEFLVNELQTLFGHKNPFICKVDNHPGRYFFKNGEWVFEKGDFNMNESYNLRLKEILELLYNEFPYL